MIARLATWVDQRVGGAKYVRKGMNKVFPEHWSFMLGEIALYAFVILVITGIYLALFFEASWEEVVYEGSYAPLHGREITASYASVLHITFDVRGGLLVRQIHHWAALVFVASIVVWIERLLAFRRAQSRIATEFGIQSRQFDGMDGEEAARVVPFRPSHVITSEGRSLAVPFLLSFAFLSAASAAPPSER